MRGLSSARRPGFTLVEILVVIVIIGILAGIAIPAITGALRTGRLAAMQTELESMNQGVEAYKTKYGDYPPDFSSWNVVQRHYRKIFPDIQQSELLLLFRLCDDVLDNDTSNQMSVTTSDIDQFPGSVMDRAEALVWSLGGFSSDPQRPFTGTGGPLQYLGSASDDATNPALYQYNADRDNRLVDFDAARLAVKTFDPAQQVNYSNRTQSSDEPPSSYNLTPAVLFAPDLFPTYALYEDASPAVYFDARTYAFTPDSGGIFNGYARFVDSASDIDAVRPLFSETPHPNPSGDAYGSAAASLRAWDFMNPRTFQVLGPGIDRRYGTMADLDGGANPSNATPVYFQFPSGRMIKADGTATNPAGLFVPNSNNPLDGYDITSINSNVTQNFMLDNMGNFSGGTFGDELE